MEEQWQFFLIDGLIILVGVLLSLNAVMQLYIEFNVKNEEGPKSHSRIKVTKHLILSLVGLALIVTRVIYMVNHNNWYAF